MNRNMQSSSKCSSLWWNSDSVPMCTMVLLQPYQWHCNRCKQHRHIGTTSNSTQRKQKQQQRLKREREERKPERKRKPQDVTHEDFGGVIRPWLNGVQQQAFHWSHLPVLSTAPEERRRPWVSVCLCLCVCKSEEGEERMVGQNTSYFGKSVHEQLADLFVFLCKATVYVALKQLWSFFPVEPSLSLDLLRTLLHGLQLCSWLPQCSLRAPERMSMHRALQYSPKHQGAYTQNNLWISIKSTSVPEEHGHMRCTGGCCCWGGIHLFMAIKVTRGCLNELWWNFIQSFIKSDSVSVDPAAMLMWCQVVTNEYFDILFVFYVISVQEQLM